MMKDIDWNKVEFRNLKKGEMTQVGDYAEVSNGFNAPEKWRIVSDSSRLRAAPDPSFPAHTMYRRIL